LGLLLHHAQEMGQNGSSDQKNHWKKLLLGDKMITEPPEALK
jgi:hypothetical protein